MYLKGIKNPKVTTGIACNDLGTGLSVKGRQQFKPSLRYTDKSS